MGLPYFDFTPLAPLHPMLRPVRPAALALTLVTLAVGCASAEGALHDGMQRERQGDMHGAFEAYATALERDASLQMARVRLRTVGADLVRGALDMAEMSEDPLRTADALLDAEQVIDRAASVGIRLEVPLDFETRLADALDTAARNRLDLGEDLLARGRFQAALDALDAARRYRPAPPMQQTLDAVALDAYAGWSEADLAAGQFRSALRRAEAACALAEPGSAIEEDIFLLQRDILDAGAVRVAFFPPESANNRTGLPGGFASEMTLLLDDEHWTRPRPFVRPADPTAVRRLLRDERNPDERARRPSLVALFTRDLQADVGVAVDLGRFRETESVTDTDTLTVPTTRRQQDATVFVEERRRTLEASAEMVIVDAATRDVLCRETVAESVRDTYEAGVSETSERRLVLSDDLRDLFDADRFEERRRDQILDLQEELAEAIAEETFACIDRLIP